MIHKLQDGDVIKILPVLKKDGKFDFFRNVAAIYTNKFIYDNSGKDYLKRMCFSKREKGIAKPNIIHRRFFCVYINGLIKFMFVGEKLHEIIMSVENHSIRDNKHLLINVKMVNIGSEMLPSYEHSSIIDKEWDIPISNKDSQEEWLDWIKKNQPCYLDDYLERLSIFNNIPELKKAFGEDFLTDLIIDDRDKKIKLLLND